MEMQLAAMRSSMWYAANTHHFKILLVGVISLHRHQQLQQLPNNFQGHVPLHHQVYAHQMGHRQALDLGEAIWRKDARTAASELREAPKAFNHGGVGTGG